MLFLNEIKAQKFECYFYTKIMQKNVSLYAKEIYFAKFNSINALVYLIMQIERIELFKLFN